MMTLNLGVIDVPYVAHKGVTTGDVAGWLENKYHVMENFYEQNREQVAQQLAESIAGALESLLMGAPADTTTLFASATTQIETSFRQALDRDFLGALGFPGTPTAAALAGVNHRLKQKKGAARPSFVDTGSYQSSFRAWVV